MTPTITPSSASSMPIRFESKTTPPNKLYWINRQIEALEKFLNNPIYTDIKKMKGTKEVSFHEFYAHLFKELENLHTQKNELINPLKPL